MQPNSSTGAQIGTLVVASAFLGTYVYFGGGRSAAIWLGIFVAIVAVRALPAILRGGGALVARRVAP